MSFLQSKRKKLASMLGKPLSNSDITEINKVLKRPEIAKIRRWDSSMPAPVNQMVQSGTYNVVRDYVINKKKNK